MLEVIEQTLKEKPLTEISFEIVNFIELTTISKAHKMVLIAPVRFIKELSWLEKTKLSLRQTMRT